MSKNFVDSDSELDLGDSEDDSIIEDVDEEDSFETNEDETENNTESLGDKIV